MVVIVVVVVVVVGYVVIVVYDVSGVVVEGLVGGLICPLAIKCIKSHESSEFILPSQLKSPSASLSVVPSMSASTIARISDTSQTPSPFASPGTYVCANAPVPTNKVDIPNTMLNKIDTAFFKFVIPFEVFTYYNPDGRILSTYFIKLLNFTFIYNHLSLGSFCDRIIVSY